MPVSCQPFLITATQCTRRKKGQPFPTFQCPRKTRETGSPLLERAFRDEFQGDAENSTLPRLGHKTKRNKIRQGKFPYHGSGTSLPARMRVEGRAGRGSVSPCCWRSSHIPPSPTNKRIKLHALTDKHTHTRRPPRHTGRRGSRAKNIRVRVVCRGRYPKGPCVEARRGPRPRYEQCRAQNVTGTNSRRAEPASSPKDVSAAAALFEATNGGTRPRVTSLVRRGRRGSWKFVLERRVSGTLFRAGPCPRSREAPRFKAPEGREERNKDLGEAQQCVPVAIAKDARVPTRVASLAKTLEAAPRRVWDLQQSSDYEPPKGRRD